jgi:rhodanese-related sulfurtransferase
MPHKTATDLVNEAKSRIREVTPRDVHGMQERGENVVKDKDAHVILYCQSANRSAFAADTLQQMGYADVASMSGGFRGWAESGGEVEG